MRPPTDGLWDDGRTDESQIGATYDELEWAMEYKGGPYNRKRKRSIKYLPKVSQSKQTQNGRNPYI